MSGLKKEFIVRQISKDLYLREDIVEEVLDRFVDIAVDEIVNTGEFRIHRLLSVSTADYKAYQAGKGTVPAHKRLKIRLSDGVNRLFKHRMNKLDGAVGVINRDTWRDFLSEEVSKRDSTPEVLENNINEDLYNPLLDDD